MVRVSKKIPSRQSPIGRGINKLLQISNGNWVCTSLCREGSDGVGLRCAIQLDGYLAILYSTPRSCILCIKTRAINNDSVNLTHSLDNYFRTLVETCRVWIVTNIASRRSLVVGNLNAVILPDLLICRVCCSLCSVCKWNEKSRKELPYNRKKKSHSRKYLYWRNGRD